MSERSNRIEEVQIAFNSSRASTLGIELELNIVDRETRALVNASHPIIETLGRDYPNGEHPKIKHELFQCTLEIITGICDTVSEARADLESSINHLVEEIEDRDLALICSGTHPFTHWRDLDVTRDDRYVGLVDSIGWPARRLAICGVHFHVGIRSAEHAVSILHPLTFHLPLFLALSVSSPYWHGMDTGMASARTKIFEGLPTAGLPPRLDDWSDFERFMATLLHAGVISTIRDVWWDVRPHPNFGTVELRMCDGLTNLTDVAALGALAQCLVTDLTDWVADGESVPSVREWVLRENKWLAARHGLDTSIIVDDEGNRAPIRDLVAGLVTELEPVAERLGCGTELTNVLDIIEHGTSCDRQRAVIAGGGTYLDVVDQLASEIAESTPR